MAKSVLIFVVALLSFTAAVTKATAGRDSRRKNTTHLRFYVHDILTQAKPTAVQVGGAPSSKTSPTLFGQVFVVDDPITAMPNLNSTHIGRVQGMYAFTSQSQLSLSMYLNVVFTDKTYNGSTISFVGINTLALPVRELTIVGGTGAFRFSTGYVTYRTVRFDMKTGNATFDVNVYAVRK